MNLCDNMIPLLNARAELWSSSSRHFSQPTHDPWWKTDPRQIKVCSRHEAWRWNEHIGGVGKLPILLDGKWQR